MKNSHVFSILAVSFVGCLWSSVTPAIERWNLYESSNVSISYIDMQSIRTRGDITSYQALLNFREGVSSSAMLSGINYFEMKCKTREVRYILGDSFSDLYGNGRKIGTLTAEMLGPNSMGFKPVSGVHEKHFSLVCKQ